jgi:uncharacterized protein YbgA (DUF1722 family)/uncharacterized protein YbbK (DUF523 family)
MPAYSTAPLTEQPVRIGISSCLLGETVRYDGGHKRDAFLAETLGPRVEWVPVCPEVESGMGTPREAMRLTREGDRLRLVTVQSGVDVTARLVTLAERRVEELAAGRLSGYILKKDSPSCGMERVKVYGTGGMPERSGRGLFASRLLKRLPNLPVEEEGRLSDPDLRDNFLTRVYAYRRLQALFDARWTAGGLVAFHTVHKLLLMARSVEGYRRLGRLVARVRQEPPDAVERAYATAFMAALAHVPTRRRHVNVLQHMAGYFKTRLDPASKAELAAAIEDYRHHVAPLDVPLTLLRHHVRAHGDAYLAGQLYLDPYPKELRSRVPAGEDRRR